MTSVTPASRPPDANRLKRKLKTVELFAGAGGLALGLKHAGFTPALVVDFDDRVYETLRANKRGATRGWPIEHKDIRELDYSALAGTDLLSAGAPCQPFSVGGRLRGENDERNMFPEVIRAARELQPKAFFLENVRGLLFPRVRAYFDYLVAQLRVPSKTRRPGQSWPAHHGALKTIPESEHEYWVDWRVLNAADFGLAQNRLRLVVVGVRKGQGEFVWPAATHSREALIAALHENAYWECHAVAPDVRDRVRESLPAQPDVVSGDRWRTLRDVTSELGAPGSDPTDPAHVAVPGARLYPKHTGSVLDWPAKTVKAGVHGCPGGEHILVDDSGEHRYLTVRECAVLQGFPPTYVLPKKRTWAMRQLGNAVPAGLAEAVGVRLAEALTVG